MMPQKTCNYHFIDVQNAPFVMYLIHPSNGLFTLWGRSIVDIVKTPQMTALLLYTDLPFPGNNTKFQGIGQSKRSLLLKVDLCYHPYLLHFSKQLEIVNNLIP